MVLDNTPEHFMREALKEAQLAFYADEVPIGAVVVHGNRIIGRGHNLTERLNDVTAHAEMQAFTAAANFDRLYTLCNNRTMCNVCRCFVLDTDK